MPSAGLQKDPREAARYEASPARRTLRAAICTECVLRAPQEIQYNLFVPIGVLLREQLRSVSLAAKYQRDLKLRSLRACSLTLASPRVTLSHPRPLSPELTGLAIFNGAADQV